MKNPAAVALGKMKTPRKAASSRKNGKLGGRPKVKKTKKSWRQLGPEHDLMIDKQTTRAFVK